MQNINERPVCHRAEDLVTYLYGEASEVDARDFAGHLQQCDACRSEFGVFQQVHESILLWRNEALGSSLSPAAVSVESPVDSAVFIQPERKLTALAALREFFSVSPLWLRGAIGFAVMLLCVLGVLAISRSWSRPAQLANKETEPKYNQQDFDRAVHERVAEIARVNNQPTPPPATVAPATNKQADQRNGTQLAVTRIEPKTPRRRGLSRQERVQLAADLRLIPRDEDELPFGLADEPNQ
jgi:anti-sigma factor RsiW